MGIQVAAVDRIKMRRLQWFGHVSRMGDSRVPYLAHHMKVDGQQSSGRPRARWRDGVKADITGVTFTEAVILAKYKDRWRKFVRPYRRGIADGRD
jgi:hypothetical protein